MTGTATNYTASTDWRQEILWRKRTPEEIADDVRLFRLWCLETDRVNEEYPPPPGTFPWVEAYEEEMREQQKNGQ